MTPPGVGFWTDAVKTEFVGGLAVVNKSIPCPRDLPAGRTGVSPGRVEGEEAGRI